MSGNLLIISRKDEPDAFVEPLNAMLAKYGLQLQYDDTIDDDYVTYRLVGINTAGSRDVSKSARGIK